MKKVTSFIMGLLLLAMTCVPTFAVNASENAAHTTITQFAYIVYDKNGVIRETGVTPNFNSKYSWSGITLSNGESVKLLQSGGKAFTILDGTSAYLSVSLNHTANIYNTIYKGTYDGKNGSVYFTSRNNDTIGYGTPIDIQDAGYFWLELMNTSSDSVRIDNVKFTF